MKLLLIILTAALITSSCAIKSGCYIATEVYRSANETVHKFENLTHTTGLDLFNDTAFCAKGDTIAIYYKRGKIIIQK